MMLVFTLCNKKTATGHVFVRAIGQPWCLMAILVHQTSRSDRSGQGKLELVICPQAGT